jgi:hypothetical protein
MLSEAFDDENRERENSQSQLDYYAQQAHHRAGVAIRVVLLTHLVEYITNSLNHLQE